MSASPALDYDFTPALTALDPHHTYIASRLSGGLVNLTARITISVSDTSEDECVFGAPNSVVAKYAPPYVAALGESAPFSQFRQVIEARALKLLSQPSTRAYMHHDPDSKVTTPTLVYHDASKYVLIMSDLGSNALTLDDWLRANSSIQLATDVGARFGAFLARLGGVKDLVQGPHLDLSAHFANPDARALLLDVAVRGVYANLLKCGVDLTETSSLTETCVEMYTRQGEGDKSTTVFGLGDCWPKSLLVLGQSGDELAVIDWEFAGMVEPLADIAQLAAHLYLLHQTSPIASRPAIQTFSLTLLRQHRAHAPKWYYARAHRVEAWTLFGREVVNNAVETDWFEGDETRREAEMQVLGKAGARFMGGAKEMADEEAGGTNGPLFGPLFAGLQ